MPYGSGTTTKKIQIICISNSNFYFGVLNKDNKNKNEKKINWYYVTLI